MYELMKKRRDGKTWTSDDRAWHDRDSGTL